MIGNMDAQEIRKWHKVFKRPDELFEIRILGDRTLSGYFYDVEEVIRQIERFDDSNIYYSVNEVKKACESRSQFNCLQQVRGTATSEQDIEHRWWIPIDFDVERPSGVSSTDQEKALAHKKAQTVYTFLRKHNFAEPIVCDSSSGYHLFYPIDMANTQESKSAIKLFLETLAQLFNDTDVKIDVVLHDANRIIRLSGTYGRKGRSTQERPHRLAKILHAPEIKRRMELAEITAFNDKFKIVPDITQRSFRLNGDKFNLRKFMADNNIVVDREVPLTGGGTKYVLKECPFCSDHKAPDSAIFEMPSGAIAFKCLHNSCSQYGWRELRLHFDPSAYDYEEQWNGRNQHDRNNLQPRKKYQIKDEIPQLGEKWLPLSSVQKIDITRLEKVKTGFVELDRKIGGLYMSEVTILSGSNASGKSSWLNSVMLNVVDQGYKTALWSGELRADILKAWIQMVAAGRANLCHSQYEEGRYYVPENVGLRIDQWLDGKFYLYNNSYGTKAEQILHDMDLLSQAGVRLFVLDNMMAMDIDLFYGDKNDRQKELILKIKDFAMNKQVHIILVAHPRKTTTFLRKNDISGTGDILNAVDNCFIIHRTNEDFIHAITDFYNATKANNLSQYGNVLVVEKNRLFGVVDFMCGFYYEDESRRFKNSQDEIIHYGWERDFDQQITQEALSPPTEEINDAFFMDIGQAPY